MPKNSNKQPNKQSERKAKWAQQKPTALFLSSKEMKATWKRNTLRCVRCTRAALCSIFPHLTAMMKQVFYLQSLSHAPQQYPVELESRGKGLGNDDDGLGSMETHKKYEHKSAAARRNLNL